MVDLFEMEDKCDKHFKEGVYAPKKEIIENVKDEEEVVHIEEEDNTEVIPEEKEIVDNNKEEEE